eukprot:tig00000042_g15408.t1
MDSPGDTRSGSLQNGSLSESAVADGEEVEMRGVFSKEVSLACESVTAPALIDNHVYGPGAALMNALVAALGAFNPNVPNSPAAAATQALQAFNPNVPNSPAAAATQALQAFNPNVANSPAAAVALAFNPNVPNSPAAAVTRFLDTARHCLVGVTAVYIFTSLVKVMREH